MAKLFSSGVYPALGVHTPFDADDKLVTSPIFSPLVLASLRLLLAVWTLVVLVADLSYTSVHANYLLDGYFAYFTHLSYIGICAYFWASGVQTMCYALGKGYPLRSWPRALQFLHVWLWSTISTFPFITTVVFWSLLSSPATLSSPYNAWSNISVHALNSALALFEILFTHAGPMPFTHVVPCLLLLGLYLCVAYVTYASQGFYTYDFLDPKEQHGLVAAYVAGIGVGEFILFSIVFGVCKLRERMFRKAPGPVAELSEDWEEVSRSGSLADGARSTDGPPRIAESAV